MLCSVRKNATFADEGHCKAYLVRKSGLFADENAKRQDFTLSQGVHPSAKIMRCHQGLEMGVKRKKPTLVKDDLHIFVPRLVISHNKGHPKMTCSGAENEARTRDPNLGKVVLYQLSYFRLFIGVVSDWDCKGTHYF